MVDSLYLWRALGKAGLELFVLLSSYLFVYLIPFVGNGWSYCTVLATGVGGWNAYKERDRVEDQRSRQWRPQLRALVVSCYGVTLIMNRLLYSVPTIAVSILGHHGDTLLV